MNLQAIKSSVMKFIKDEEGLTIVEYAVAGGIITLGVVGAITALSGDITTAFNNIAACVNADSASGGTCPVN